MEGETVTTGEKEIVIERRYAVLQVTPEFLIELAKGSNIKRICVEEFFLPPDARIVGVGPMNPSRLNYMFDASSGVVGILVQSETFENVLPGAPIPILQPPKFKLIEEAPVGFEAKCPSCGKLTLIDSTDSEGPKKLCTHCNFQKRIKQ